MIVIDSTFRKDKNHYLEVFLEECKYVVKEKRMSKYVTDDINISSGDSDRQHSNYSDNENSNE